MDSPPQPRSRFLLAAAIAWMVVVFVADLLTPLGVSVWALYVPAILVAAPSGRPKVVVLLASACSALTIAGFFLSPPGGEPGWGVANRAMGLLALWLSAWAAVAITRRSQQVSETLVQLQKEIESRQQSETQLRELTGQLEQRVTERTGELEERKRRAEAILQTAVEGIVTINERGIIDSFNPAAEKMFGYMAAEVIGQNVSVLMPSPDRERHDSYLANYLRTGQAKIIGIGREVLARRKDGTLFPMDLSVGEVRLGDRRLFTALLRDITERRALEQAVANAAEQERARIARELHDGLGQQLGGLLFLMNGLYRDLQAAFAPQAETVAQLRDELSTAINQARNLSHELYAVPPQPDGLMQALDNLAERVSTGHGVTSEFASDTVLVHDPIIASHLYRVAQEAVHNALKHSRATRIWIELTQQPDGVELRVRDNGIGFTSQRSDVGQASSLPVHEASVPRDAGGKMPPEPADKISAPQRGLGLRTMEQRARLIGGRLRVQTQPSAGVEVICSVPRTMLEKESATE